MGKRSEQEPEAIRLYAEGMDIPQISAELKVSENSLRDWKKRAGTEWDDARASFRKGTAAAFEDVGKRVARARATADRLTGDVKTQGKMGIALNQALQTVVWDFIGQMQTTEIFDPETMATSIEQCQRLATTLQRLEQAANLNLKREAEIRRQVLQEVSKKVDEATQGVANQVMTAEAFQKILKETYGA